MNPNIPIKQILPQKGPAQEDVEDSKTWDESRIEDTGTLPLCWSSRGLKPQNTLGEGDTLKLKSGGASMGSFPGVGAGENVLSDGADVSQ